MSSFHEKYDTKLVMTRHRLAWGKIYLNKTFNYIDERGVTMVGYDQKTYSVPEYSNIMELIHRELKNRNLQKWN